MLAPTHVVRRSLAASVMTLLILPMMGALHRDDVDHDGATRHVERAHGGHALVPAEGDSRLTSGGLKAPAPAVVAQGVDLSVTPAMVSAAQVQDIAGPSTRGPPGTLRARAPPRLT